MARQQLASDPAESNSTLCTLKSRALHYNQTGRRKTEELADWDRASFLWTSRTLSWHVVGINVYCNYIKYKERNQSLTSFKGHPAPFLTTLS